MSFGAYLVINPTVAGTSFHGAGTLAPAGILLLVASTVSPGLILTPPPGAVKRSARLGPGQQADDWLRVDGGGSGPRPSPAGDVEGTGPVPAVANGQPELRPHRRQAIGAIKQALSWPACLFSWKSCSRFHSSGTYSLFVRRKTLPTGASMTFPSAGSLSTIAERRTITKFLGSSMYCCVSVPELSAQPLSWEL